MAYLTVGTGIGGGLAIGGRTLKGVLHPEVGHLRLRRAADDDVPSACPFHTDCAEGLCAGPAIGRRLGEARSLAEAPGVFARAADYLGQLCEALVLAWSPQRIVLGGGVMDVPGLRAAAHRALCDTLGRYGPGEAVADPGYLAAPALGAVAGLEGAMELARDLAGALREKEEPSCLGR